MKRVLVILLGLVCVVSLIVNVLLYQRYSTSRPLMRIGNEAITVKQYRDQVDYEYGKTVLTKMAYGIIILDAAKKAGVLPTEQEVNARLEDVKRNAPKNLEAAFADPHRMEEVRHGVLVTMALENLTIKDVTVTDAELRDFYQKNKAAFAQPMQASTTIVVARNSVDAATAASLLKNPQITPAFIAKQPQLAVVGVNGYEQDWNTVPRDVQARIAKAASDTPVRGVTTVPAGGDLYFVVRVDTRNPAGVVPFEKARPTVERMAKLKKAEPQLVVLARLYQHANVRFEMDKYEDYFRDLEGITGNSALLTGAASSAASGLSNPPTPAGVGSRIN